jgi:hypothetical protein
LINSSLLFLVNPDCRLHPYGSPIAMFLLPFLILPFVLIIFFRLLGMDDGEESLRQLAQFVGAGLVRVPPHHLFSEANPPHPDVPISVRLLSAGR